MGDDGLRRAAAVNPGEKLELLFKNVLERLFVDRMNQTELALTVLELGVSIHLPGLWLAAPVCSRV